MLSGREFAHQSRAIAVASDMMIFGDWDLAQAASYYQTHYRVTDGAVARDADQSSDDASKRT